LANNDIAYHGVGLEEALLLLPANSQEVIGYGASVLETVF
jgi:hypothetical protein